MRTTKLLLTLTLASLAALTIGCGKQEGNSGSGIAYQPYGPYVPSPGTVGPGTNPGTYNGINWDYGSSGEFTSVNTVAFYSYLGCTNNCPTTATNFRINFNLQHFPGVASAKTYHSAAGEQFDGYGGVVTIAFDTTSPASRNEDRFSSLVNPNGMVKTNAENNKYNKWIQAGNQWHGFFQDYHGSIIVIIDGTTDDYGDGGDSVKATGEVWFRNHPVGVNLGPLSPTSCWFVLTGPYDCRSWVDGNNKMQANSNLLPSAGYTKLGEFSGISVNKGFNSTLF